MKLSHKSLTGHLLLRYKDHLRPVIESSIGHINHIGRARKQARTLKADIALGARPRGDQKITYAFFTEHYLPYVKQRWPPSLGQQIKNHKCTSVTININLSYLL